MNVSMCYISMTSCQTANIALFFMSKRMPLLIFLFVSAPIITIVVGVGVLLYRYDYIDLGSSRDNESNAADTVVEQEPMGESVESSLEVELRKDDGEDASELQLEESVARVSYTYRHEGNRYIFQIENPQDFRYVLFDDGSNDGNLVINIADGVQLAIDYIPGIDQDTKGGAYGDLVTEVGNGIYRTRYNLSEGETHHYVLGDIENCEDGIKSPCTRSVFHVDKRGALRASITDVSMLSPEQIAIVDEMMLNYRIIDMPRE